MCEAAVGSHGSRRPRRGALFALQTRQRPPEWGVHGCNGSPPPPSTPPTLGSPITEFGSEDVKQTRLQMALLFTCLRVPLPPPPTSFIYWDPQCHFQEPHGNSGPCQRGGQLSHDVTAPCDWRSAAERQNSVGDPNGTDIWTLELRLDLCSDLCIRLCIL